MKVKVFKAASFIIGETVPTNQDGHAGRYIEKLLEQKTGIQVNRGHGPDFLDYGLELKTRNVDATSAQTVADMNVNDIINTNYKDSHVFQKFQQQLRVYIKDNVIISADVYDFSHVSIQDLIEKAYNYAKKQLVVDPDLIRTKSKDHYGYFEKCELDRQTFSFRINKGRMKSLEQMANSNYKHVFLED